MRDRRLPALPGWPTCVGVLAVVLLAVLGAGLIVLAVDPEAGGAPRRWIKRVDHAVLGSFLHRRLLDDPPTDESMLEVPPPRDGAYDWAERTPFIAIAHALGPSLGSGPNTLETLEKGRALGFTVFEVDLVLTADGVLACYHGAGEDLDGLTWAEVRQRAPAVCRFDQLVALAREHGELRVVLDVKNRFHDAYDRIADLAGEGDDVTGSFIPQLYHFSQLRRFREVDMGFAGAIFTAYRSALPLDRVLDHARRAGVRVVTLPVERVIGRDGSLPDSPSILSHPVNDPFQAARLRRLGVDGIYTSYLTAESMPDVVPRE